MLIFLSSYNIYADFSASHFFFTLCVCIYVCCLPHSLFSAYRIHLLTVHEQFTFIDQAIYFLSNIKFPVYFCSLCILILMKNLSISSLDMSCFSYIQLFFLTVDELIDLFLFYGINQSGKTVCCSKRFLGFLTSPFFFSNNGILWQC